MSQDLALLILRLVAGGLLAAHGSQKLFGWFGGYGFAGTRGFMGGALRLRPAALWTLAAGLSELGGGALLAAGLLNPFGALAIIAAMLTAAILAHWPKVWITENGLEYVLVLGTVAASVAIGGPGAYSLDEAFGIALPAPATFLAGLAFVALGVATALVTRAPIEPAVKAAVEAPPATSHPQAA